MSSPERYQQVLPMPSSTYKPCYDQYGCAIPDARCSKLPLHSFCTRSVCESALISSVCSRYHLSLGSVPHEEQAYETWSRCFYNGYLAVSGSRVSQLLEVDTRRNGDPLLRNMCQILLSGRDHSSMGGQLRSTSSLAPARDHYHLISEATFNFPSAPG